MNTIKLQFKDADDLRTCQNYIHKAKTTEGSVAPLWNGLMSSAMKRATVEPKLEITDDKMNAIGARLAEALRLRRDSEHRDRWQTDWGTKTNQGLFLTLREMLDRIERGEESTV